MKPLLIRDCPRNLFKQYQFSLVMADRRGNVDKVKTTAYKRAVIGFTIPFDLMQTRRQLIHQ